MVYKECCKIWVRNLPKTSTYKTEKEIGGHIRVALRGVIVRMEIMSCRVFVLVSVRLKFFFAADMSLEYEEKWWRNKTCSIKPRNGEVTYNFLQILLKLTLKKKWKLHGMWRMRKKLEMLRNIYLENMKGRDHVKDLESFKMNLKEIYLGGFWNVLV